MERIYEVADESIYGKYLIARLQWLQGKHAIALTGLEKALGAFWDKDNLHIEQQAIEHTSTTIMERIMNCLGQLYKFYGYTAKSCICY